jgi:RsiW-degrading membrane proteinase PrsW (M82 family)
VAVILFLLSVVAAIVPPTMLLALVWWFDRYDREPVWLLVAAFLWGATGAVVVAILGSWFVGLFVNAGLQALNSGGLDILRFSGAISATFVAPLVEEPAKALPLIGLLATRHFDNATDGFVYGAACGLGFALTENFLYFMGNISDAGTWLATVIVRTGWSATMHATASAVVGAALGWARFRGWFLGGVVSLFGLAGAMSVHAAWNGLLSLGQVLGGSMMLLDLVMLPLEIALIFVCFQACLWLESRTIRRELGEEAAHGTLPAAHVDVLASSWRRRRGDWTDGIAREPYIAAATRLAMRRGQLTIAGPGAPLWLHEEIAASRNELRRLQDLAG